MGLLAAGVVIGVLFAPPDPEAVQRALDRVVSERAYQTDLPGPDGRPIHDSADAHPRHRTGRTAARRDPREAVDEEHVMHGSGGGSAVAAALFYVVLGALAVLFLVWLATEWKGRERRAASKLAGPLPGPAPASMDVVPLDEVDALAAEGRFAEAIHVLLLRTIAALPKAAAAGPAPSLTSREILDRTSFRAGAREAMGGLVDAVEVSLFGGRPVPETSYRECRTRFDRFVAIQTGGSA